MKIVIDTKYDNTFTATSKARDDVNKILIKKGFIIKNITIKNKNLIMNILQNYIQLKEILKNTKENSTLLFQYPFDSMSYKYSKTIKKICNKKHIKTIVLIHDLNMLRTSSKLGKIYFKHYVKEIKFLNNFDKIICHNETMKAYLLSKGIKDSKLISLKLFDYLIENNESKKFPSKDFKQVIIAGNLSKDKAGYLYEINNLNITNYEYILYGINYQGKNNKHIKYKGVFQANNPKEKIQIGFGLVWDGSSYNECNGNFGNYLKWNNPHKFSLYMATGIPVIVWNKSALAEFVKENNIGIVISSLKELNSIFEKMTYEQYKKLNDNVSKIQNKVINGRYLSEAIKKC